MSKLSIALMLIIVLTSVMFILPMLEDGSTYLPEWIYNYRFEFLMLYVVFVFGIIFAVPR